ncbi:MAG: hypothetical protein WCY68_08525 [Desulfuromonadales bacterium]
MHRYIRLIFLAGLILALTACGSSRSDEEETAGPTYATFGVDGNGVDYIGADRCVGCHAGLSSAQVLSYRYGRHVVHSTAIDAASPASCLACHDPIGDGGTLERFIDPAHVPAAGLAAVGCENCHGAGGDHFGIEPIPNPLPGVGDCGKCHTVLPVGPAGHVGGSADGIMEDYAAGGHAATVGGGIPLAVCSRCHSDEGFRAFAGATAGFDAGQISAALTGAAAPANLSSVQCRTCHDSHSGQLRAEETTSVQGGAKVVQFSQQFNLCTACHQVFLQATYNAATESFDYTLDRTRLPFHGTAGDPLADGNGLLIWDTHFSSPSASIAGYAIDAANPKACTTCHDPHRAD